MQICFMKIGSNRRMNALTGVSIEEFSQLHEEFSKDYEQEQQESYERSRQEGTRQREQGAGRPPILKTSREKLFFVLFYFKVYPTFDVLGATFQMGTSTANENLHHLAPILHNTLERLGVLPQRSFVSLEDFREKFKEEETMLIDVLERSIQRPQDNKKQEENYSGKQKDHTIKHLVISTVEKVIQFISESFPGRRHDYAMLKSVLSPEIPWFEKIKVLVDLGFLGIKKDYKGENIEIPHKKPRKSKKNPKPTLTEEQKAENKAISQIRVFVEHAIGGIRRFAILVQDFRNKKDNFADDVISLASGLWNFSLQK